MPEERVDHPKHYNTGQIEVIELLKDWGVAVDFCLGNAIKYIARHEQKGTPDEDLRKALWYLKYLLTNYDDEVFIDVSNDLDGRWTAYDAVLDWKLNNDVGVVIEQLFRGRVKLATERLEAYINNKVSHGG